MTAEGLIELSGALVCVVGIVLLMGQGRLRLGSSGAILAWMLSLLLLVHVGEGLEWLGWSAASRLAETLVILVPTTWVFLFFTMRSEELSKVAYTSESQLRRVLDDAPVPLAILCADGEYLATSASWRALFGSPSAPPDGSDWRPAAQGFIQGVVEGIRSDSAGIQEPMELRIGPRREWVLWSAAPYHTAPDVVGGHVVVLNVLTEAVEADAQAQSLQTDLERVNRSDLVGLLSSGVAHDVRNFLMVVQAHVDLLQLSGGDTDEAEQSIEAIRKALELSTGVLKELTHLTRREVPQAEPLDLVELVRTADRLLRRCLPPGTRLLVELPQRPVLVQGAGVKLQQVLLNLVTNAREALPEGGLVTLTLREDGPWAILEVRDDGLGMSEELRARIFDRLFTTKDYGTGLGLSIVSKIVKEHDGDIQVQSAPGEGTCFRIRLPLLEVQGLAARSGT